MSAGAAGVGPAGRARPAGRTRRVAPTPGGRWSRGSGLDYAQVGDRLRLTADRAELDLALDPDTTVATRLEVGALVGADAPPVPVVEACGGGRRPRVAAHAWTRTSGSALLRPAPADPLPIYPDGPGLGETLGAVAGSLVPLLLDELAGLAASADAFERERRRDWWPTSATRWRCAPAGTSASRSSPPSPPTRPPPCVTAPPAAWSTTALTTLVDALDPGARPRRGHRHRARSR